MGSYFDTFNLTRQLPYQGIGPAREIDMDLRIFCSLLKADRLHRDVAESLSFGLHVYIKSSRRCLYHSANFYGTNRCAVLAVT